MEKKFYTKEGHLNDVGIALVIDALHRKQENLLPKDILEHLKECNICFNEVQEMYEFTEGSFTLQGKNPLLESEKLSIASFLQGLPLKDSPTKTIQIAKPKKKQIFQLNAYKLIASILLIIASLAVFFLITSKNKVSEDKKITEIQTPAKEDTPTPKIKEEPINTEDTYVDNTPLLEPNPITFIESSDTNQHILLKPKTETPSNLAIIPALKNVNVPFIAKDKYNNNTELIAEEGKSFYFENGSHFHIPASAFVDKDGKVVVGKVNINYREFHEASEIIASGIPMNYTQNGIEYPFESGGMFELRAEQNGESLFLASNKRVKVNLASNVKGDDFNFYYLNQKGNPNLSNLYLQGNPLASAFKFRLKFLEKPSWELLAEKQATQENTAKINKIDSLEKLLPNKITNPNRFTLQFNTEQHKELKELENSSWTFAGWDKKTNPNLPKNAWIKTQKWDKISITPLEQLKTPLIAELKAHQDHIISVDFSPNNQHILTGSKDFSAKLWDIHGTTLQTLQGHQGFVTSVCFSSTGNFMLTGSRDKTAKLWSIKGKLLATFRGHTKGITKVMFFPVSNRIMTASLDGTCKIWDLKGNIIQNFNTGIVYDFDISKDGQQIFTAQARKAQLWNLEGKVIQTFDNAFKKQEGIMVNTLTILEDKLITGDNYGQIIIWNHKGKVVKKIPTFVNSIRKVAVSPDKNIVANGGKGGVVAIWDTKGKLLKQFAEVITDKTSQSISENSHTQNNKMPNQQLPYRTKPNASFIFSKDGRFLLTGDWDNIARVWLHQIPQNYAQIEVHKGKSNNLQAYARTIVKVNDENKANLKRYDYAYMQELEKEIAQAKMERNVIRSFEVENLGIYNWDKIYKAPNAIRLVADFKFEYPEDKQDATMFLVTGKQRNIVIKYKVQDLSSFYFEPNLDNQIIAILPDNRMATFSIKDFAQLDYDKIRKEKQYTFDMNKVNQIKGMKDLKQIIKS